jgi:hypothetical protein
METESGCKEHLLWQKDQQTANGLGANYYVSEFLFNETEATSLLFLKNRDRYDPEIFEKEGIEKWFSQHPGTWMPKKEAALEIECSIFSGHRVLQNMRILREYWELDHVSFQALQQGAVKAVPLQDLEGILAKATVPLPPRR